MLKYKKYNGLIYTGDNKSEIVNFLNNPLCVIGENEEVYLSSFILNIGDAVFKTRDGFIYMSKEIVNENGKKRAITIENNWNSLRIRRKI